MKETGVMDRGIVWDGGKFITYRATPGRPVPPSTPQQFGAHGNLGLDDPPAFYAVHARLACALFVTGFYRQAVANVDRGSPVADTSGRGEFRAVLRSLGAPWRYVTPRCKSSHG
jgi:hypothetical protein